MRMPVLFVGHGSPMNIVQDNEFTRSLREIATEFPTPKEILSISAHWLTNGTFVTGGMQPRQIYDFYGFPQELYKVVYEPLGSPGTASLVSDLIGDSVVATDEDRGIDHGTWAVLKHMYPEASTPTIQLSIDNSKSEGYHFDLGKKLRPLRGKGVLILGSGNIVHNLRTIVPEQFSMEVFDWARSFDTKVKELIMDSNDRGLVQHEGMDPKTVRLSVPTNDHYLPMLYSTALKENGDAVRFFHESFQHGSISMRSFVIGI